MEFESILTPPIYLTYICIPGCGVRMAASRVLYKANTSSKLPSNDITFLPKSKNSIRAR